MYNFKVLSLVLIATALAYLTHLFLKKRIDPRRSASGFLAYIFSHLAIIVIWVFIFTLVLTRFRDFFFKK